MTTKSDRKSNRRQQLQSKNDGKAKSDGNGKRKGKRKRKRTGNCNGRSTVQVLG